MIEVISRWYGLSQRSKQTMLKLGKGDYQTGKNMWLNLICFMTISIYCGALELGLRENNTLNPEHDRRRLEQIRSEFERSISYIASRINLLNYKEEVQHICEIFGQLIEQGYISFTKVQRNPEVSVPNTLAPLDHVKFEGE